jgi:hypothetical protein
LLDWSQYKTENDQCQRQKRPKEGKRNAAGYIRRFSVALPRSRRHVFQNGSLRVVRRPKFLPTVDAPSPPSVGDGQKEQFKKMSARAFGTFNF